MAIHKSRFQYFMIYIFVDLNISTNAQMWIYGYEEIKI